MRSSAKVVTLLFALSAALASGEEVETTTTTVGEETKQPDSKESNFKEEEGSTKSPEKRGLYRVTGVHGENLQPYFVYTIPQQATGYQQPSMVQHYEPRAAAAVLTPKYEQTYVKPYPNLGYNAQPTYQQPYVLPSPSPSPYHNPYPYSTPAAMILLMTPPHPGNPYGSLMLVPTNNLFPQYTPNHVLPYQASNRIPIQLVPQYVPVPVKGFPSQNPAFPASHFKGSEYPQKLQTGNQQYLSSHSYQEQPGSAEEQDQSTMSPSYGNRVRPQEQYVKG